MINPPGNPLDDPHWDSRIARLPGATFFHTAAWARVLIESYGYRPLYRTLHDGADLQAIWPLMEVESGLTGKRGISLPFTDACAPLSVDAPFALQTLFAETRAHGTQRGWKYVEWRGEAQGMSGTKPSTAYFQHRLELHAEEAAQAKRLESATRRAVRKAYEGGLTVEFSQSLDATREFYALLEPTRKRHGVPPQPFSFFAALQRHALAPGHGWIVLARHKGRPLAGALCLHAGRTALYKYGASLDELPQLRAGNRVIWEAIRHYGKAGFAGFDFGRTSLHNDGLRRFKQGWGAAETRLEYFRYDLRARKYVEVPDNATGWRQTFFQKAPAPLSRWLGALLYRHVA